MYDNLWLHFSFKNGLLAPCEVPNTPFPSPHQILRSHTTYTTQTSLIVESTAITKYFHMIRRLVFAQCKL